MDIIVFGSAIVDLICYAPRIPKPGETLHGNKFATGFGGKGANQCVAAAKLGAKCALVAKVGDDTWGVKYLDNLKDHNVCIDFIEKVHDNTGIAQITVAESGENQIVIISGANSQLSKIDAEKAFKHYQNAKILICQQETPIEATVEALKLFQGISILNAAPAIENTPKDLIIIPTFLCVNETEASIMTSLIIENLNGAKQAVLKLLNVGANSVILTMGKEGALYSNKTDKRVFHIPSPNVENIVDTTGAGDAFIGSFAYFQSRFQHLPVTQHIGAACEMASLSVQKLGTQSSFCTFSNFETNFNIEEKIYNIKEL